jgi:hypothetical protein
VRRLVLVMVLALLVGTCGRSEISLSDYAAEAESLLTALNVKIDALDADAQSQSPTVQGAREFWDSKVEARRELIAGLEALEPPQDAAEMHATAVRIISRLASADEGVAQLIGTMESDEELAGLLQSPEFLATEAVDEEAIALCQAAQADFDATADREVFVDMPWIPSELQEVVLVFLGCSKQDRGATP